MAKTLEKFFLAPDEPRAIVLLDLRDLEAIGAIERGSYGEARFKFKGDPALALTELLNYELRAATRVVTESGPVEIIVAALSRFREWTENARKIRKRLPGIWMEEEPVIEPAKKE